MSAAVLREAAALMRERAASITSGAQWTGGYYWIEDYDPSDPTGQTSMQRVLGGMDDPDATHYASWSPPVALAVADWLDAEAAAADEMGDILRECGERPELNWTRGALAPALAVARAYLGPPG